MFYFKMQKRKFQKALKIKNRQEKFLNNEKKICFLAILD